MGCRANVLEVLHANIRYGHAELITLRHFIISYINRPIIFGKMNINLCSGHLLLTTVPSIRAIILIWLDLVKNPLNLFHVWLCAYERTSQLTYAVIYFF